MKGLLKLGYSPFNLSYYSQVDDLLLEVKKWLDEHTSEVIVLYFGGIAFKEQTVPALGNRNNQILKMLLKNYLLYQTIILNLGHVHFALS